MEAKDKVIYSSNLENVEEIEHKIKKKSLIKFLHVFESKVERKPAIRKSWKKNLRHNSDRNYNPLEKIWQVSDSYYYLNPRRLYF